MTKSESGLKNLISVHRFCEGTIGYFVIRHSPSGIYQQRDHQRNKRHICPPSAFGADATSAAAAAAAAVAAAAATPTAASAAAVAAAAAGVAAAAAAVAAAAAAAAAAFAFMKLRRVSFMTISSVAASTLGPHGGGRRGMPR
ncbi:MAG: hypothetical protein QF886_27195, partial [Planctomycetota bacterium]|nr:hypothetical protein [Planctomycetota bacterium]